MAAPNACKVRWPSILRRCIDRIRRGGVSPPGRQGGHPIRAWCYANRYCPDPLGSLHCTDRGRRDGEPVPYEMFLSAYLADGTNRAGQGKNDYHRTKHEFGGRHAAIEMNRLAQWNEPSGSGQKRLQPHQARISGRRCRLLVKMRKRLFCSGCANGCFVENADFLFRLLKFLVKCYIFLYEDWLYGFLPWDSP